MLRHRHAPDSGENCGLSLDPDGVRAVVCPEALLVLAPPEPGESHPPAVDSGLPLPAVLPPAGGGLAEVDDGVLGGILGEALSPGSNDGFDHIPPGPEGPLREPFAHLQSGLELPHRPVVGETGIARVLPEQGLLLRGGPERDAVGLLQESPCF